MGNLPEDRSSGNFFKVFLQSNWGLENFLISALQNGFGQQIAAWESHRGPAKNKAEKRREQGDDGISETES